MSGETVLVVDDAADVVRLVRGFLEDRGYAVLTANAGAEALRVAEGHAGPIQALLTDVVMPGLTGPELADQLMRTRHETKVVFMSGFTREVTDQYGLMDAGSISIGKPFTAHALVTKLREAIDYHSPFSRPARGPALQSRTASTVFTAPRSAKTHEA